MEPPIGLPLPEDVEVSAGTKLRQQTGPPGTLQSGVESGEKWVFEHLQDAPLNLSPPFFVPGGQLLPVHHLGCKVGPTKALHLHQVDAPNVPASETVYEPQVPEPQRGVVGGRPSYHLPPWVAAPHTGISGR